MPTTSRLRLRNPRSCSNECSNAWKLGFVLDQTVRSYDHAHDLFASATEPEAGEKQSSGQVDQASRYPHDQARQLLILKRGKSKKGRVRGLQRIKNARCQG